MLVNRSNGLAKAVAISLILGNCTLFMVIQQGAEYLPWYDMSSAGSTVAYIGMVFVGVFYVSRRLFASPTWVVELTPVERVVLALRLMCGFLMGAALIHFFIGSMLQGRLIVLSFLLCSLPFNFGLLTLAPTWLVRRFFPSSRCSRAVVVGSGPAPAPLQKYLQRFERLGVKVVGHYGKPVTGLPWPNLGTLGDLFSVLARTEQGEPGAASPLADLECMIAFGFDERDAAFSLLMRHCARNGIRLQAYARLANAQHASVKLVGEGELNFLVFMEEPLQDPLNRLCKRALDLALSIPVVLFVLPWLMLCVWAVQQRYSPGPVMFKQLRRGANRRPFQIYKFRTMHQQASDHGYEFSQARPGDPRVFRFGDFLRRTSIDEFPQFINVLLGDMSIVGPRPHPLKLDEDMEREMLAYRSRHFVRPGITGYAQVLGLRGETPDPRMMVDRVRRDIEYIDAWSLTFDLKIILQTSWQIVSPRGRAY